MSREEMEVTWARPELGSSSTTSIFPVLFDISEEEDGKADLEFKKI